MVGVLICGRGSGAYVMSALMASKDDVCVNILTNSYQKSEDQKYFGPIHGNTLTVKRKRKSPDEVSYITSKPCLVTCDPAVAAQNCDVIILVAPSYTHHVYLSKLKPYVEQGCVLVGCPGRAGFHDEVSHIFGDKLDNMTLISLESLPWACRVNECGNSAEVLATKSVVSGAIKLANKQTSKVSDPVACLQYLLGTAPKLELTCTFLGLTLKAPGACIHPGIMYGYWGDWDGNPLNQPPLFYNGVDQDTADLLSTLSAECVSIATELMETRPGVSLQDVQHLYQWLLAAYPDDIADKTSLFTAIQTNRAYKGLYHPCTRTAEGQYQPDFTHRYLREDVPYGLVVIKGIAQILGVDTPTIDKTIHWAQIAMGVEFLIDGRLCGKDLHLSRAPQVYGITSVDGLIASGL